MKTKIVIFPSPNQQILLRDFQKKICSALNSKRNADFFAFPRLPLCVESENLKEMSARITKIEPTGLEFSENKFFLLLEMCVDGENSEGRLELCRIEGENPENEINFRKPEEFLGLESEILAKIKKISPFRLALLETESHENGLEWKVTEEKWGKI